MEPNTYYTHNNGSRPFKVIIQLNKIEIYNETSDKHIYSNIPDHIFNYINIFIGKCPIAGLNKEYAEKSDGNSILINSGKNEYIFIGYKIFSFISLTEIISFISPVRNSNVPYPYAIDSDGNTYLLIEEVILINDGKQIIQDDPYHYYYKYRSITNYVQTIDNTDKVFCNIERLYLKEKEREMIYYPFPDKYYDNLVKENKKLYIKKNDLENKTELTKQDYIEIINSFGKERGFQQINIEIIYSK